MARSAAAIHVKRRLGLPAFQQRWTHESGGVSYKQMLIRRLVNVWVENGDPSSAVQVPTKWMRSATGARA